MAQSNGNGNGGGALPSELLADGKVIGAKVCVITQADDVFEGVIFTVDPVASFLILGEPISLSLSSLSEMTTREDTFFDNVLMQMRVCAVEERSAESPAKSKTRMFQIEALKKIEVLEKAPADVNLSLPNISEDDLLRMEQRNKGVAERALASIGKDVSAEAQTIFDALNKTMPCEWEGQNIRVMGDVLIKPPYQPQNCVSENAQVLSRVKKVLEGEKNKLKKTKK